LIHKSFDQNSTSKDLIKIQSKLGTIPKESIEKTAVRLSKNEAFENVISGVLADQNYTFEGTHEMTKLLIHKSECSYEFLTTGVLDKNRKWRILFNLKENGTLSNFYTVSF